MCQALAEQEVLAEEECSATIEEWVPSGSEYAGDEASCTSGCEELLAECPLEQQASLGCFWALDHESWFYCYQEETGEWSGTEVNEEPCAERLAALEACYGG